MDLAAADCPIRGIKLRIVMSVKYTHTPKPILDVIAEIRRTESEYKFLPLHRYITAIAELLQDGVVRCGA
jgi:hypothetical protein